MGIGSLRSASSRFTCGQLSLLRCRPREADAASGSGPPPAGAAVATAEAAAVSTCAAARSGLSAPLSKGIISPAPGPRRQKPGGGKGEDGRESGWAGANAEGAGPDGSDGEANPGHTSDGNDQPTRKLVAWGPADSYRPRATRPLVPAAVT